MGAGESKLAGFVERGDLAGVKEALKAGEDADCNNKGDHTPLHKAAEAGYHNIAVALIEAKANVHAKDKRWKTQRYEPLHFAAENGHKDIVLMLVCAGASLSSKTASGDQAIHLAIKRSHHSVVTILITAGADVSTGDQSGKFPIQLAVQIGALQTVQALLIENVDISTKDEYGNYVIHLATQNNHLNIVSALISAGADVSVRNNLGKTPLHIAVENGNVQIVQALVDAGIDISAKDENGDQVHHLAAATGKTTIMNILLTFGADVSDFNTEGKQALHLSAENGHHTVASILLTAGADLSTPDWQGDTAAHIAALNGNIDVLKVLRKHGDDFSAFSSNITKFTPLHSATENGHMNAVQWLVRNGAPLHCRSGSRMTAEDIAKVNFHDAISNWFVHVREQHKNVLEYAKRGDFHSVMSALDVGANASSKLLHLAIVAGKVRVVQAALSLGTGIEDSSFFYRYRPIHYAAEHGHSKVVHELLKAGADHTAVEYRGRTALHIAASSGHEHVLEVMITFGCDIEIKSSNRYKWTPLHYAAWEGQLSTVKWLAKNDADLAAKDSDGNTPFMLASKRKWKDVVLRLQLHARQHQHEKEESCGSSTDEDADTDVSNGAQVTSEQDESHAIWCHHEQGDAEIPEICYNSVEGVCDKETRGCPRLHSTSHYHWQAKEPFGFWLNLPEKHVNCLEHAFCDVNKNSVILPPLDAEGVFTPYTLIDIMGKDPWHSNFQDMTLLDPSNRRTLKLRRLCSERVGGKPIKPGSYVWYFLDRNKKWVKYGNVDTAGEKSLVCNITSDDIEKIFLENPSHSVAFQNAQYKYLLDFKTMTQKNINTDVSRDVRRRPQPHAIKQDKNFSNLFMSSNSGVPAHWESMENTECWKRIELSQNTKEYLDICILLQAAVNSSSVEKIERIQNPFLWFAFQNKVREMTAIYGSVYDVNVCQLFHGTNATVIDKICAENFDWRLHGTSTGQMYGRGTYFSPNIKTAYAYCKSDSYGRYYLFLAKVAMGMSTTGNPEMIRPPTNPNTNKMYDSTVDSESNPNIIVKYDKQEYYPEYIVTINHNPFRRITNLNGNSNANCTIS